MKVLLLTGGGHIDFSSGLETTINALRKPGNKILASLNGWKGIQNDDGGIVDITSYDITNLSALRGSFLGSSRTKPDLNKVERNIRRYHIDAVIAFGGEDTLGVAAQLYDDGIPVVGWPKTMDNDLNGSYATIGYPTAVSIAARSTLESISTAYTHSRIVLLPMFGRNFDWIVGAASAYGHADFTIPAERKDLSVDQVAGQIEKIYFDNQERYGRPFAVVAVSEAASSLGGLEDYIHKLMPPDNVKKDDFGHPKLEPEITGYALKAALSNLTGISGSSIAIKALTYHLKDGHLIPIDENFARASARECVELVENGDFGAVATIQDPSYSGFIPNDPSKHIQVNGATLYVGSVPLKIALERRPVNGTGFYDYTRLKPTAMFDGYLAPLLGQKPEDPRKLISPFTTAALD